MFEPGTLWRQIQATTTRALQSGALQPIGTRVEYVEDCGLQFQVRIVSKQARADQRPVPRGGAGQASNPFLPFDRALHVADASDTHVCLLNKYMVVDRHVLLVTRQFQHQQSPLTRDDFVALWRCLAEYDSLGFYNAGTIAGASQPHKHLQVVPLPLGQGGQALPLDPCLVPAGTTPWPPFRHALSAFDVDLTTCPDTAAEVSVRKYRQLLARVGLDFDALHTPAYNLLVTRSWMLLVPRIHECFESISLNALAFAGALLVRDEAQLNLLRSRGPMSALRHTAGAY